MRSMFYADAAFNQKIDVWDVSNVGIMQSMFQGTSAFNQPLWRWDASKVTNTLNMFDVAVGIRDPPQMDDCNKAWAQYIFGPVSTPMPMCPHGHVQQCTCTIVAHAYAPPHMPGPGERPLQMPCCSSLQSMTDVSHDFGVSVLLALRSGD